MSADLPTPLVIETALPPAPVPAPVPTSGGMLPAISPEARRTAGTILEVMAGVRSITDAAIALSVTPARYQQLELRAVCGLIAACEPRPPGPSAGALLPAELERLIAERDRLRAEVARYQALVRIAQGAFGTAPPVAAPQRASDLPGAKLRQAAQAKPVPPPAAAAPVKIRKKRRPTVRALRLAKRVREDAGASQVSTTPGPAGTPAPSAGG